MDDLTLHWKLPPATIFFFSPFCFTCNQNQKEIATSKNHFRTDNDWHCVSCVFVASVFLFFFCCVFLKKFAKIFSTFWFGTSKHKSTFKKISRKSTGTWFLFTKIVHYKFTHTDIHHLLLFDFLFILLTNLFVPCPFFFFFPDPIQTSQSASPPISLSSYICTKQPVFVTYASSFCVRSSHRLLPTSKYISHFLGVRIHFNYDIKIVWSIFDSVANALDF